MTVVSPVASGKSLFEAPTFESGQRRPTVLVVDGDASTRSVLEVALHRDGFLVSSVTSGREALIALGEGRTLPALVVLSTDLQGEDGYSLCAQLRGDRRTAKLPVLLLANQADDERQSLAEVVGADEFLPKPVFARDVSAMARLTLGLDSVPLPQLLRALLSAQKTGTVTIAGGRGQLVLRRGVVIDAQLDGERGPDAVLRALMLVGGPARFAPGGPAVKPQFQLTLRELVTMIFPRLTQWEQLASRSVPLDEKFAVNFGRLALALPTMPDAVNQVVRLFDGQRTVRQVLLDSALNETITLEVANRLHLMKVVTSLDPEFDGELKEAPRLFEPRATEAEEDMRQLFGGDLDGLLGPVETPAVRVPPAQDWYQPARGSGLEVTDPTEGWSVRAGSVTQLVPPPLPGAGGPTFVHADTVQMVDEARSPSLISSRYGDDERPLVSQSYERQLYAFNVRPVIDAAPLERHGELQQFRDGVAGHHEPGLEHAIAQLPPIKLTQVLAPAPGLTHAAAATALEDQFFAEVESSARTVVDAVLGPVGPEALVDEDLPEESAEQTGSRVVAMALFAALLIAGAAVVAWRLSTSSEPEVVAAPAAGLLVEAPPAAEAAGVVHLAAADDIPPPPPASPPSDRMQHATRLYEQGQLKQAAAELEQVVAEESSNTTAWLTLGLARYDLGDNQGAQEAIATVFALDPKMPRAHLLQATLLLDANKRPAANQEIQTYLELDPNGQFADEARALLKR